ncbi:MAG: phage holin family protein [Streptomyces sp.]|uniref:phage holin family protein n=1 Tax=Streptomyces sp. TaxID=1931 RepID=UPI0025D8B17A|nr:phage holin family protein [Streptomyces sp.]MBW8794922.1 phage holin family protein [Streptomyces sp.]
MEPLDHLEHLDKDLVDELAQVARETVRDELREQGRKRRRAAMLYGASGAVALYAGAAVALAVGLAWAILLPAWAAALVTAVILGAVAYALREAGRPKRPHPPHRVIGGTAPGAPPSGMGLPYPPMPTASPGVPGADPESPHHRT